jgi:hypothetical protein
MGQATLSPALFFSEPRVSTSGALNFLTNDQLVESQTPSHEKSQKDLPPIEPLRALPRAWFFNSGLFSKQRGLAFSSTSTPTGQRILDTADCDVLILRIDDGRAPAACEGKQSSGMLAMLFRYG